MPLMSLLIPYAACAAPASRQILASLQLPNLTRLLARMETAAVTSGDAFSPAMPHEVALATLLGLPAAGGQIPWAARYADQAGLAAEVEAWAFITPCHWHVGTDQLTMANPADLALQTADLTALHAAMQSYFAGDGITLLPQPVQLESGAAWLAKGELFRGLASASLDRVIARNVNAWMPEAAAAAPLRRLQNEMQMLLYTHPVNDARQALGKPAVNSFWVHGAGALAALPLPAHDTNFTIASGLRAPALAQDWPAWARAWQEIDSAYCSSLLASIDNTHSKMTLILCGEQNFEILKVAKSTFKRQFMQLFTPIFAPKPNLDVRMPL